MDHSTFVIPGVDWWKNLRLKLLTASQVLSAIKIARVKDITQAGWDESEIDRRNTLSVWTRIAKAESEDQYETIFLAAAKLQVGAAAEEVASGVAAAFTEARIFRFAPIVLFVPHNTRIGPPHTRPSTGCGYAPYPPLCTM